MNSRRLLIFGSRGQLAQSLAQAFKEMRISATFVGSAECDFRAPEGTIAACLNEYRPNVVINASAYTQVDKAESEVDEAFRINAQAPGRIADWCASQQASLVHISTDYVYSGEGTQAWKETDPTCPPNQYGLSKLAGEERIRESGCHHVILRTSWVFSPFGVNFVKTMLRLRDKESLRVVNDQVGSPTYAPDLARAIVTLVEHPRFKQRSETFNLCNQGMTTWSEFARAIFTWCREHQPEQSVPQVQAIPSSEYPTPARRPLNSRMDTSAIEARYGIRLRFWQEALSDALGDLLT